jgi:hypothetical protein
MMDEPEIDKKQEKREKMAMYIVVSWVGFSVLVVVAWIVDWIWGAIRG